jgi:excisionase family DNA binding protein
MLTFAQAAEVLGCSAKQVRRLVAQGVFESEMRDGRAYLHEESVREWHRERVRGLRYLAALEVTGG